MSTVPQPPQQRIVDPRFVLPVLLVLVAQVAMYAWMAARGFEFTDEAYYLHNYLHWREFTGTVTFFGAYFEWPFRLFGGNIAAMRLLSLALVLGSAAVLTLQLLRYEFPEQFGATRAGRPIWYVVAPVASAMLFFSFLSTLRAPSYNVLSVVTISLMTACVLRVLAPAREGRPVLLCFLYGLALGVCFLSKATTAALVTLAHLVFFCVVFRDWKARWLLRGFLAIVAGFALNFIVLQLAFPQWLAALREGIELVRVRDGAYSALYMFNGFRWDFQKQMHIVGPWLAAAAVVLLLLRARLRGGSRIAVSAVALAVAAAIAFTIMTQHQGRNWLIVVTAGTVALWLAERWAERGQEGRTSTRRDVALMLMLLFLPVAFSYGTNMSVLAHSVIASLFAFSAVYVRLYRLASARLLAPATLAACLLLMCLPALLVQWRAWTDVLYTYRQVTALERQELPVRFAAGGNTVLVDPVTGQQLDQMQAMAREAGMLPGQDILDLTGDGPGVIYVLGGNPLGSPWLLGGFPGSPASVERVMQKVDGERIRRAWLLVSSDNPRRIEEWEAMLARRIGPGTHQQVGTVTMNSPHANAPRKKEPSHINVQLWKPLAGSRGALDVAEGRR